MNIGAIIQVRMDSTRLPEKVLMCIPLGENGKPLLQWITDGLKNSKLINTHIIATTQNEKDKAIVTFANRLGIHCFCGDENDVLNRFVECIVKWDLDVVVRMTGDNPIVDIEILDNVIEKHILHKNDYTCTTELPVGMNFEVISAKSLIEISEKKLSAQDREHVTLYIRNNDDYKKERLSVIKYNNKPLQNLRLTVDYPSDFLVMSVLLSLTKNTDTIDLQFIEKIYMKHPWIFDINRDNIQKKQFQNVADEVSYSVELLKKWDMNRAAEVLSEYK